MVQDRVRRVLLVTTSRSYRNEDFRAAAARLDVEVVIGLDMKAGLAESWAYPLGMDMSRPEEAAQLIVDFANQHPLAAILAVDDSGTLVAALAARRLGLPHNAPDAAEAARDKFQMRTLMSQGGVPCPPFWLFCTNDDPQRVACQVAYPCVVKPLDLNGSRGVIRADDESSLTEAVSRLTRLLARERPSGGPWPYLVEGFILGREVALEGILDDGELHMLALFDKPDPLDGPFFEETIYVTPSRLPQTVQAAIHRCVGRAARAVGLRLGPVHAELRVNEAGPWMLEIAGRSIGGLCSHTLRFGTGVALEELILRQACGLPLGDLQREGEASGVMMIPIPAAGILHGVTGLDDARRVPGIQEVTITAKLNYPLEPLPEGASYLGFIFGKGESAEQVEQALRQAHGALQFEIMPELSLSMR